ncbi:MAG: aminotransferase class V-fold PLP-dependent enzyme [Nitrospirae bacterium]|nr:aminotransferase class V-fold PLP-dependent enzyme [Nitrospirota bacterium]
MNKPEPKASGLQGVTGVVTGTTSSMPGTDYPENVNLITAENMSNEPIKVTYQDGFESVYSKAFDNHDNKLIKITYPINEQQASRIKEDTGLDVAGYNRTIDNYSIRHILNKHGDAKTEASRGQIEVTKDDLLRIPEIVNMADDVAYVAKTKVGREGIQYTKKINGHVYYLEEVRSRHNELNPVSMWKVKSSTSGEPSAKKSYSDTSKTLRVPPPSTDSTIPQPDEVVKSTGEALTPIEQNKIFAGISSADNIYNSNKTRNKEELIEMSEKTWYDQLRAMFNGLNRCVFLNSAGVAMVSKPARDAVTEWAELGQCASYDYNSIITEAKKNAAAIVSGTPDKVFLSRNTTHGIQTFILGYPWQRGDGVVIADCEFPANRLTWLSLREKKGVDVKVVKSHKYKVSLDEYYKTCDKNTKVIAISWVQYLSGQKAAIGELGKFCRENNMFLVVDGIQGIGAAAMDAEAMQIDWLSADGHKWMCGPEGVGLVWTSQRALEIVEPACKGWFGVKNPFDFENFDQDYAPNADKYLDGSPMLLGIMAFNAALKMLLSFGIDKIEARVLELSSYTINEAGRRGWEVLTPHDPKDRAGIVTFKPSPGDPALIMKKLLENKIVCSLRGGQYLRISAHACNNHEDIDRAFYVIDKLM